MTRSLAHTWMRLATPIALLASTGAAAGTWPSFRAPDFELELPAVPVVSLRAHASPIGTVLACRYVAAEGGAVFSVTVTRLPRWVVAVYPAGRLLRSALARFLDETRGSRESVATLHLGSGVGRELRYSAVDRDGAAIVGRAHFVLAKSRIYLFDAALRQGADAALADRFLAAVRLGQEASSRPPPPVLSCPAGLDRGERAGSRLGG